MVNVAEIEGLDAGLDHGAIADDEDGEASGLHVFLRDALNIGGLHRVDVLDILRKIIVRQVKDQHFFETA